MPSEDSLICVVGPRTPAIEKLDRDLQAMERKALEGDGFTKRLGTTGVQEVVDDLGEFRVRATQIRPGRLMEVCPDPSAAGYVGHLMLGFICDGGHWYSMRMSVARHYAEDFMAYCDSVSERNGLPPRGQGES